MLNAIWRVQKERYRYWRSLPLPALARVMLAGCLTFSSMAFATDLTIALQWPFWFVLAYAGSLGAFTVLIMFVTMRRPKALLVIFPAMLLLSFGLSTMRLGLHPLKLNTALLGSGFDDVRWRLLMDGSLSMLLVTAGFLVFLTFVVTQGVRHIRVRTELELAEKLQQTLAPPLAARNAGYEIQGRSAPSSQMGGD
jgi:uncharacterized membrane protein